MSDERYRVTIYADQNQSHILYRNELEKNGLHGVPWAYASRTEEGHAIVEPVDSLLIEED